MAKKETAEPISRPIFALRKLLIVLVNTHVQTHNARTLAGHGVPRLRLHPQASSANSERNKELRQEAWRTPCRQCRRQVRPGVRVRPVRRSIRLARLGRFNQQTWRGLNLFSAFLFVFTRVLVLLKPTGACLVLAPGRENARSKRLPPEPSGHGGRAFR